jgi:hypothetical protein
MGRESWPRLLGNRNNPCDFGDLLAEIGFDAHLQGEIAAGAADAGAVEADADDAVGGDVHQLDVAAIGHHGGADQLEDALDALVQTRGAVLRCG